MIFYHHLSKQFDLLKIVLLLIHIDLSIFQNNSEKGAPKFIFKKIVQCRQVILYRSFLVFLCYFEEKTLN